MIEYSAKLIILQCCFSFQPPGDTPTRKSFYDSLLSGCIPVIFTRGVRYPFQDYVNYDNLMLNVDEKLITVNDRNIVDILQQVPLIKVLKMQDAIATLAVLFQYGDYTDGEDAMTMLLRSAIDRYNMSSQFDAS